MCALPVRQKTQAPVFFGSVSRFQVQISAELIARQLEQSEEVARAIFNVGISSIAAGDLIVDIALTLAECVGIESKNWDVINGLKADLRADQSEKISFPREDPPARRLSPSQVKLVIDTIAPIFGDAPELGDKPTNPGPRPGEKTKEFPAWQKSFRALKRWEFIRDWNKGFSDIVIGDGCHRVRPTLALMHVFQNPDERKDFAKRLDEAYATDQAARETTQKKADQKVA